MSKALVAGIAIAAALGVTSAQAGGFTPPQPDLVVVPVVPVVVKHRFEGAYLGGTLGYAFGSEEVGVQQGAGLLTIGDIDHKGAFYGLQLGARRLMGDKTYGGVELRLQGADIGGELANALGTASTDISSLIGVRGSLGRLVNPETLVYGFAGISMAKLDTTVSDNVFMNGALDGEKFTGYSVGFGVERALNDKWSIRGEYEYTRYGAEWAVSPSDVNVSKATPKFSGISVGFNYAF